MSLQNNLTLDVDPNSKQLQFFLAKQKFIFYGGAKGGGKSWALRTKQVMRRLKYPNSKGLLLRRTYPELLRTHIIKLMEELPKGSYDYNSTSHLLKFPNGSILELGSAQHEADILNYHGAEYDDIGIDEATQFTEYQYNILKSCLRTIRTDLKTQMYLGANPGGVGHGWVKRRFVLGHEPDDVFIPAKVYDNPVLIQADPTYIQSLQGLPEHLRRMYLEGDWDVFAGQVFNEWRVDDHVVNSIMGYTLKDCKKIIGFDWGYSAPGCAVWLAYTPENSVGVSRVYVYRELYLTQKSPDIWAKLIAFFCMEDGGAEYIVLPHDCYSRDRTGESIADTFQNILLKIGVHIRPGYTTATNAVQNRLAITHKYLQKAKDSRPYLQVLKNCRNLIRTLPELVYSETNPETVDDAGEDHAYDALSVGLMSRVIHTLKSSAVKPTHPQKVDTKHWEQTSEGDIKAPNFWDVFKNMDPSKIGRNWEYK